MISKYNFDNFNTYISRYPDICEICEMVINY